MLLLLVIEPGPGPPSPLREVGINFTRYPSLHLVVSMPTET
jgi:hypothetical protein